MCIEMLSIMIKIVESWTYFTVSKVSNNVFALNMHCTVNRNVIILIC
jgi:hypothetical protein